MITAFHRWRQPGSTVALILLLLAGLLQGATGAVLWSETFESGLPAIWSTGDTDANGVPAYWGVVDSTFGGRPAHSGIYQAYCAGVGFGGSAAAPTYQNSESAYLSRPLILTNLTTATLRFWYRIPSIEEGVDQAQAWVGTNLLWSSRTAATNWTEVVLSLVDFLDATNTLKFNFVSDTTVSREGWYVDDVQVTDEYTLSPPPPNDNFALAARIHGALGGVVGENFEATSEPGEPGGLNSIWYKWKPWTNGPVTFTTSGSTFDTLLCVYTGNSVTGLVTVACNDNDGTNLTSLVTFEANPTNDYRIMVGGANGQKGKVRLAWTHPNAFKVVLLPDLSVVADPTKNLLYGWYLDSNTVPGHVLMRLSSATPNLGIGPVELIGTNTAPEVYQRIYRGDGSYEDRLAGEFIFHPTHNHLHFNNWLEYRLRSVLVDDAVGPIVAFGTKISFSVIDLDPYDLSIPDAAPASKYKGGFFQGVSPGWMDVYHAELPDQWIDITGVAPGRYWLEEIVDPDNRIVESNEDNNMTRILIELIGNDRPPNDDFTNAIVLTGPIAGEIGGNQTATLEPGEPAHFTESGVTVSGASIWYRWLAPKTGYAVITTDGSSFDTMLAIYTGSVLTNLTLVAKDDSSGDGVCSRIRFMATSNTLYSIAVTGYKTKTGRVALNINPDLNNMFVDALSISNFTGAVSGSSTIGETSWPVGLEPGEPVIAGVPGGRSQWFNWVPDHDGQVTFDTRGSGIDTILGVYLGSRVDQLALVASDDNSGGAGPSRLTFYATNGLTYRIAIDGTNGVRGVYKLNWKSPKAPTFLTQPGSTNVLEGTLVRLTVLADGAEPLSYQWLHNDLPIVDDGNFIGSRGPTLVIGKTLKEDDGRYSIVLTNSLGSVTSAPAHIIVLDNPRAVYALRTDGYVGGGVDVPIRTLAVGDEAVYQFTLAWDPTLLGNPRVANGSATQGALMEFDESQVANGLLGTIIRIQGSGTMPPGNSELAVVRFDISPGAIPGATGPVFFKDAPLAKKITTIDAQQPIAVYAAGEVTFHAPPQPPAILVQPVGTSVLEGSGITLTVTATGDPPLAYQWRQNGVPLVDGASVAGSTQPSLSLSRIDPSAAGKYSVVVSNPYGVATSTEASLVVLGNPRVIGLQNTNALIQSTAHIPLLLASQGDEREVTLSVGFDPQILGNPSATLGSGVPGGALVVDSTQGTNGLLGIKVTTATNTLFTAGTALLATLSFDVSSAASDGQIVSLTITNTPLATGVTGPAGASRIGVFHGGLLALARAATPAPAILSTSGGTNVVEGGDLVLTVIADGAVPLGYTWFFNSQPLADGAGVSGSSTPTLLVQEVVPGVAGSYSVVVTNAFGGATSAPVTVGIIDNPRLVTLPTLEVFVGETASIPITLEAVGNENSLTMELDYNAALLTSPALVTGPGLPGETVNLDLSGAASGRLLLTCSLPPGATIPAGTRVVGILTFAIPGSAPVGQLLPLTIQSTPGSRRVLDPAGADLAAAFRNGALTLRRRPIPPTFLTQPAGTNLVAGGDLLLTAVVAGDAPLSFQWSVNGLPLSDGAGVSGSATATLSLSEASPAAAGDYTLGAVNPSGSATSLPAHVSVGANPRWVSVVSTNGYRGETAAIPLLIAAQGNEQTVSLSLQFNPTVLSAPRLQPGSGLAGATLTLSTNGVPPGLASFQLSLPPGSPIAAGTQLLARVLFDTSSSVADGTPTFLLLTNAPTPREVRDGGLGRLPTVFTGGTLTLARRIAPPALVTPPASLTVVEGEEVTLSVLASGDAPLTYAWRRNGTLLTETPPVSGTTDSRLILAEASPLLEGDYTVQVSNSAGSITSPAASLVVTPNPRYLQVADGAATPGASSLLPILFSAQGTERSLSFSLQWTPGLLGTPQITLQGAAAAGTLVLDSSLVPQGRLGISITLPTGMSFDPELQAIAIASVPVPAGASVPSVATLDLSGLPTVKQVRDVDGFQLPVACRPGHLAISAPGAPPVLLTQPQGITAPEGSDLRLGVAVSGVAPIQFQWRKGGVPLSDNTSISGSQTPTLLISSASTGDSGSYDIQVTGPGGSLTSSPAPVTLTPNGRLVALADGEGILGGNAALPITLASQGNEHSVAFSLLFNPQQLTLPQVSPGPDFTGGTLEIDPSRAAEGLLGVRLALTPGGLLTPGSHLVATLGFSVPASDPGGGTLQVSFGSTPVTRGVRDAADHLLAARYQGASLHLRHATVAPVLTRQPAGTNLPAGGDLVLSVAATGDTPLTYEWRRGTQLLADGGDVSGATTPSLLIRVVDPTAAGSYTATVKNSAGSATSLPALVSLVSNPRTLTLGDADAFLGDALLVPLLLASQGDEHQVTLGVSYDTTMLGSPQLLPGAGSSGASLELSSDAATPGSLNLRITLPSGGTFPSGGDKIGVLQFSVAPGIADGQSTPLRAVDATLPREVRDSTQGRLPALFAGGVARFHRKPTPPTVTAQPAGTNTVEAGDVLLHIEATGDPTLSFQWLKEGAPIADSPSVAGTDTASLILSGVTPAAAGSYSVRVSNPYGEALSAPAQVVVSPNPRVVRPGTVEVFAGDPLQLPVRLDAQGDEHQVALSLAIDTARITYVTAVAGEDAPGAVVTVDPGSLASGFLGLTVTLPPGRLLAAGPRVVAMISFTTDRTAPEGSTTPLIPSSTPVPRVVRGGTGERLAALFTGGEVTFHHKAVAPSIVTQPAGLTITEGQDVALQVVADGDAPLSYRWTRDGVPVTDTGTRSGSAAAQLWIREATLADGGTYRVMISNGAGTVTSDPATLTLIANPRVVSVGAATAIAGGWVAVPLTVAAQGDENAISLSLHFDDALLSPLTATVSESLPLASVSWFSSPGLPGNMGIVVTLPSGQSLPAGKQLVAWVYFQSSESAVAPTWLTFTSTPTVRSLRDTSFHTLPAVYVPGQLGFRSIETTVSLTSTPVGRHLVVVHGLPGRTYSVETSVNLVDWSPVSTGQADMTGVLKWLEPAATDPTEARFFRARLTP